MTAPAGAGFGRTAQPLQQISLVLIAAVAENGVIGRNDRLPWRLKSDMQHFRRVTMGKPVVLGRKTFQTLFNPLQGRTTIVVTRDRNFMAPGVVVAHGLETALAAARGDALRRGADSIMVAGGSDIYAQAMPLADRLLITLVHVRSEGDAIFPPIDATFWREIRREMHAPGPDDGARFSRIAYERADRAPAPDD